MQVAIVSDTHVPSRASALPAWVRDRLREADHVVHAGDFESRETLETVTGLAGGRLTAVKGNVDRVDLGLPAVATLQAEGVRFVVTHGDGPPRDYRSRVASVVRETGGADAVGVAGHTHDPLDTVHEGVRLLNPGSATGAWPAGEATMLTAAVDGDDLSVTLHRECGRPR